MECRFMRQGRPAAMTRKRPGRQALVEELSEEEEVAFSSQAEDNNNNDNENNESSGEEDDATVIQRRIRRIDNVMSQVKKSSKLSASSFASQSQRQGDAFPGGTIQSIELINFMCHSHLKVDLKSNVNFIVGNNGSGKSAILTALTVGLGARAKNTQRADSVQSLIKEGAAECRIIITISNQSLNPFKADLYGDGIIVERRIRRAGANSYRTRSVDGRRIISQRKDEVVSICDHYCILVDNPLAILSQETAKKFLVNSTPANLYDFFMKATNLEQISTDMANALERTKMMEKSLEMTKSFWPEKEDRVEELQSQLEGLEHLRDSQEQIDRLRSEIAWSKVISTEKTQSVHYKDLEAAKDRLFKNENINRECDLALEEAKADILAKETEYTSLLGQKRPITNEKMDLQKKIDEKTRSLDEIKRTLTETNNSIKADRKLLQGLEEKIQAELAKENDEHIQACRRELEAKETNIVVNNKKLAELRHMESTLASQITEVTVQRGRAQRLFDDLRKEVEGMEIELSNARSAEENTLRAYGQTLPEAMQEIAANRAKFTSKPIGPIGSYVNLKQPDWAKPIAAIIGSFLGSFITTSHEDRKVLQEILTKHRCQNNIIVISPTPIDFRGQLPDRSFLTALDVLEITDELVKKALVMMTGLERIILSQDRPWAMDLIGNQRPQFVDAAFTMTHRISATRRATISTALFFPTTGNPFTSSKDRVREMAQAIKLKIKTLEVYKRDLAGFSKQMNTLEGQKDHFKREIADIQDVISGLKQKCRELEDQLAMTDKTAMDVYEREKAALAEKIELNTAQCTDAFAEHERILVEVEALRDQVQDLEDQLESFEENCVMLKQLITEACDVKRDIEAKKISSTNQCTIHRQEIASIEGKIEELHRQLAEFTAEASRLGERMETRRTVPKIEDEMQRLQESIDRRNASNLNYSDVKADLDAATEELEKSKAYYEINKRLCDNFIRSIQKRVSDWTKFRSALAGASNTEFKQFLLARNFGGSLDYDHVNKQLYIDIQVTSSEEESHREPVRRDIKQLSGGEKSFGTTCFLISLWGAMGCPVHCLDEFDVFMDPVNRRLVIEMLVNYAYVNKTKCQLILITPVSVQGCVSSEAEEIIHTVMMHNPDRGNHGRDD